MPEVRGNFAEKWSRVTPQRAQDYEQGVQNPRRQWQEATENASDTWETGIQKAAQNNRFKKGVTKAGNQRWQEGVQELGVRRFGEGVQAARDRYRQGFEPYAQTIEQTQLPPRFPTGDPRNIERVSAIAQALRNKKVGGSS